MGSTPWQWPGSRVVRVIDGDTLDALVQRDLGFGAKVLLPVRLRINGINAPAHGTEPGQKAYQRVVELTAGVVCTVTTYKPYKYGGDSTVVGEWMADVILPDGTNLADLLVRERLAVVWNGQGPRPADT